MNESWSDQDLSQESDLTVLDSQSGTSEGEFEDFEEAGHHMDGNNMEDKDQTENGNAVNSDGLLANHGQSTEEEEDDNSSYNSSEHHSEVAGEEGQAGGPLEKNLEDSGESVEGGETVEDEKRQPVINMHHVDLILDNIDAELNDIINRSLNSEHSEHDYHSNGTNSETGWHSQKSSLVARQELVSSDNATADEGLDDDSAADTGLGTGSHPGDSSPISKVDPIHHRSAVGNTGKSKEVKGMRLNNGGKRSSPKKKFPKRQILVELSDGDSICSDDIRIRMEETLHFQDSDTDSQHSHNPSHSHDALPKHKRSLPSSTAASDHTESWNKRCGLPDKGNQDKIEVSSQSDDNHETQEISLKIQEMVSLVLSDSTTEPLFEEASPSHLGNNHQSQYLPTTNRDTKKNAATKGSGENGRTHQSLPLSSRSFLEHRRAGRGIDTDSIATEDFEHVFQKSIVMHELPSTTGNSSPTKNARKNPSNRNEVKRLPTVFPKKTDHLRVPGMGKKGKSRSKKKRTNTLPTSKPSGLPEYMYFRKGLTESDVGSDSIRTKDYESRFADTRLTDQPNFPKYANQSNLARGSRAPNVQSDPESIQTEEYEQRFRSLMVKQVAGVPVKSFDQVTIASDLESVETGMVHKKFQEALRKGPEVRVFNEFGDESDLDPLQMEEVERKFQAIVRKKKMEKMRHSHKDGDTEDEGTSDQDSVRAIPSKSETGSPPISQAKNRRSNGHRNSNGAQAKPSSRSRDASPRTTTRSSPHGALSSPVRSQLTTPWSTLQDVSPSPPQQSSTAAVATVVNFPFNHHQPGAAKSCGNHHERNPAREQQATFPSWQDPSVGRQRAAVWNAQRQDSFSTYEEVESLNSHQCSSLQSLDNSCGPSRLQSFGSTSSSLDQSVPQVDREPWPGGLPAENYLFDRQQDNQGSSLTSDLTQSASVEEGRSGHLKEKSRRSLIEDDEDEMNSSVAKWVDQTRAETARRRSYVGLPEDPLVKSHEAPEGSQRSHDLNIERSLTALKMQCGDVIPGKSGRRMRLPNETDLELALRVGNSSPVSLISRCASLDSSHSSAGSDHPEGDWTIAEDVLINLGFGGANVGIPSRFLKSWKKQMLKQRVEEVRRLLGNTTSNHLLQHLPTKPEKTHSPKEKIPFPRKTDRHNQNQLSISTDSPRSSSTSSFVSDSSNSNQGEDAVMSRQHGADKTKLVGLRRSLKKAATVSSFGQTLSEISNTTQGLTNQQIPTLQQGDPPTTRRSPGGGKYSLFHKSHKSSARDRRRKYMKKQSSLPISLETLQEEDESLKPILVKLKQADAEGPSGCKNLIKSKSLEVGDEPAFHCKLKIVMEQPSIESREAMSRQGTTDVDVDEAIADVDTDKKDNNVSMEQYLVVKAIIDSKDSGFENELSQTGSPQISPRSSEDETVKGTCSKIITTADSSLFIIVPSNETNVTNEASASTCPDENFQGQYSKQEKSPKTEELPSTESKQISDTSRSADMTIVPILETRDTTLSGRSSSTSSDRKGPSSEDIQNNFRQTIEEGDDDVFHPPVEGHIRESVSACCQTSPSLHSPLLSPLFFLSSISEYPDGNNSITNISPEIFVMPRGSTSDKACKKGGASAERHDSLESVKTTADGLISDSSTRSLSQEISDGGLSIITEKDEEQGFGQEPFDQASVMDKAFKVSQELRSPLSVINNKTSDISAPNCFQFDDLPQNSEPLDPTISNAIEKSRNPFKSSDRFYSSPRHSKVDFDFDATIEEDEDGEQYSDGESFSKVTFSEVTAMMYEASNLVDTSASDHLGDNSKEIKNSSPCLSKDNLVPEMHCSQFKETDLKTNMSSGNTRNNTRNKLGTDVNSAGSWDNVVQDGTDSGQTGLDHNDFKESSHSGAQSDAFSLSKQPSSENDILNKEEEAALAILVIDGMESEEKLTSYEKSSAGCQHVDCHGNCVNSISLRTAELANDTVPNKDCNQFLSNQAFCDNQEYANNPDGEILTGNGISSENDKMSNVELVNGSRQTDEANFISEVKSSFFAMEPTEKHTEFLDRLNRERNRIEDWKLGFDQPQIMRSTSVEAHLNFQRRKLRTLSERSTLYSDGMEPLLSGFGRIITERSSTSTEGFGSLGSDIFRRPLTTTQTLQQVAAKLESHIRQRSLVSIQDDESEEENEQGVIEEPEIPYKQTVPEVHQLADIESTEKINCVQPDENGNCKFQHEDYEQVKSTCKSNINVYLVDTITTDTSKSVTVCQQEVANSSKLFEKNLQDQKTIATSANTDVSDVISQNIQVDGTSDCKPPSDPADFQNTSTSSHENCTGVNNNPENPATKVKRRSWQFQAAASCRSSNFLSVPSFNSLSDSITSNPLPASLNAKQVNSNMGSLPEVVADMDHNIDFSHKKELSSQSLSKLSELPDTDCSPQIQDLKEFCKIVTQHLIDVKDLSVADKPTLDLSTGVETSCTEHDVSYLTEPRTTVEFQSNGPTLKQSQESVFISLENLEDNTLNENEKSAHLLLDKTEILSYPTLVYPTYSSVSEVQNDREKLKSTSDFVFVTLVSANGLNLAREGAVVHSQYYRCEKFVNVSMSSEGKVDFVDAGENDSSYQIPTFLSEVKFPALSNARCGSSCQTVANRMSISSQGRHSLDCPSLVKSSHLSPTFEQICTKAGKLMQQLQNALANETQEELQRSQVEIENRDKDKELDEVHQEEEEGGFTRDHQPNPRVNGYRHPEDAPRMKQGNKKKKRLSRNNGIKTSTPKENPIHKRQGDSRRDIEGDVEEGTSNDHQATIRELLETEIKMRRKLDELESSFEEVSSRKQDALDDLQSLRDAVHRNKHDIQKAEEIARENMERADGLRSELMVLEYQRDQARRDLEDLTQSLGSFKQSQILGVLEEVNGGTGNNLLGLSPKKVIAVIKERDELKMRLRNGEGDLSPIERSELERQLNYTKQELFNGQKSSREKLDFLEEELEESRHRIDDLLVEKTKQAKKVKELQALVESEQSDEMHSHIEERNQLLEQLSSKLQKELDTFRHQAHERDQRLQSLTATASEKDALNSALGDKVVKVQQEGEKDRREAERRVREVEGKVRNADVAKELALVELRESLLREKEEEMEQLKLSLEKEKREALAAMNEKTSEMMNITQRSLAEKEEDLKAVKMQLVQHTEEANKMEQQLREQAEEQIKAAVDKERREREEEYSRRRREENVEKELEVAKETSRLQGELHVTRQRLGNSQTTIGVLKEELDKLREENLGAGREKVEAVSEAREKAREDIQRELDQVREQLAKENLLEVDRMRMKLRQQEEELTKLRSEVKVHQNKMARSAGVTGSKSILAEINEECKRTAAVIGSTPMKLNISSIRGSKLLNGTLSPKSPDSAQDPGRTQVMAALTNLRISNEELRNYVQTLKTDLDRQKRALSKVQKEKDEEVKKVANTIEKKSGDMDTMRDRLIQDHLSQVEELQQHISRQRTTESALQQRLLDKDSELREIQQSMTQWKEETALKMAKKFEEELGKELEIRLQETDKRDGSSYRGSHSDRGSRNSSGNGSPSTISSASDASTIRLLRHLQERVKQLRTENMTLRRSSRGPLESSGEERASPHSSKNSESEDKDHLLYQLQQRVKLLERQLQVAEERCRDNAASVSEKMSENGRLQGALTQQTKELMKMERAYSKLASPVRTPLRL